MSLTAGSRLGPYEVTGRIGAGGMGEVWRAIDTTLGRQVALKVLDDIFARHPDRLSRLDREARALAALNHPNVAAIYGVERSSRSTVRSRRPSSRRIDQRCRAACSSPLWSARCSTSSERARRRGVR